MKKIYLIGCLLLWTALLYAAEIRGKLIGYRNEAVLIRGDRFMDTLQVTPDGNFTYYCRVTKPYMQIQIDHFGRDIVLMMLNENDRAQLTATKDREGNVEVVFDGDHKELNHYLTHYMKRNGFRTWPMEELAAVSFKEHAAAVEEMEKELSGLLDKAALQEDKAVITYLRNDLYSSMLNLKQRYCWAVREINKVAMDQDPDYVAFNRGLDLNDEAWLEREKDQDITGYPGLVDGRIRWEMAVQQDSRANTELNAAAYMEWARKLISNERVANYFVNRIAYRYFNSGGNDKLEEIYKTFLQCSTDSVAIEEIGNKYKEIRALGSGTTAPDFEMKDENGKIYRLSDFKGKLLYIDIWATWCGPCCQQIPFMEKKYRQYKDNLNIEFISISVDHEIGSWKKKVKEDRPAWRQFIADRGMRSDLCKRYGISAIPRFLLIDPAGQIITVKAPRPSDPKLDTYLEKYGN